MKKIVKFILPLLLIGLFFGAQTVRSDYQIALGEQFTYDVVNSEQSIQFGINSADTSGYSIAGNDFQVGTSVTVNVTEVDPLGVDYTIAAGGFSKTVIDLVADQSDLLTYMAYPVFLLEAITLNSWNQGTVEGYHQQILMIPFLSYDNSTWTDWINLTDDIHNDKSLFSETYQGAVFIDAAYENTTTLFIFEFIMRGDFGATISSGGVNSIVNTTILHQYQFAYDKTNGVMQGMRMEGSISGLANGTVLEMSYNYQTEIQSYNLPELALGGATWPFSGYGFVITFCALSSITIAVVIIVRYKK